jgi:large subunit ribosomal protein L11
MAKRIQKVIRLQIPAGKASPAPPVGPALGQHGINIMAFCKEYNERTASQEGFIVPAEITIYVDRSFSFVTKMPPASDLLRRALGVEKGSSDAGQNKIGELDRDKIRDVAKTKMADLNTTDIDKAVSILEGTARSMGIELK